MLRTGWWLVLLGLASSGVRAEPPLMAVTVIGAPSVVFSPERDACDGDDVPDANARAFRDAGGGVVVFAMHTKNRALRGRTFDGLKLDCRPPLESVGNPDPGAYDDASWITATWTDDGRRINALVHHEYHADRHGTCRVRDLLGCWYNTVLSASSVDEGRTFQRRAPPAVVAAAPFPHTVGQGRHRGFFNPSNIFSDGRYRYFMTSSTGWDGQPFGPCLFRTATPENGDTWRALGEQGFTIRYEDPYRSKAKPAPCRVLSPFPAPVGAVVRHRGSGGWLAVFQAKADGGRFARSGFYVTTSRDLVEWDVPRLILEGHTLYDDPCGSGGTLINYPSLIDPDAKGRNFDDVGDEAELFFTRLRVDGCTVTSDRELLKRRVRISAL
jgi:hypothetical protein